MGQAHITVINPEEYDGRQYMPREKHTPWPRDRRVAPGEIATYFCAQPPG